jgi:hypothetical protein
MKWLFYLSLFVALQVSSSGNLSDTKCKLDDTIFTFRYLTPVLDVLFQLLTCVNIHISSVHQNQLQCKKTASNYRNRVDDVLLMVALDGGGLIISLMVLMIPVTVSCHHPIHTFHETDKQRRV